MHTSAYSKIAALTLGIAATSLLSAGCGSRAGAVCSLVCDCEHCNDYEEEVSCTLYQTQADVADAYGCADQWDAWAACVEEKGTCDDKEANFSTATPGRCNAFEPTTTACMTAADCVSVDFDLTCEAGMCARRVCSGGGQGCQNDGDCSGDDLCDAEDDALDKCIDDASKHGGTSVDFD